MKIIKNDTEVFVLLHSPWGGRTLGIALFIFGMFMFVPALGASLSGGSEWTFFILGLLLIAAGTIVFLIAEKMVYTFNKAAKIATFDYKSFVKHTTEEHPFSDFKKLILRGHTQVINNTDNNRDRAFSSSRTEIRRTYTITAVFSNGEDVEIVSSAASYEWTKSIGGELALTLGIPVEESAA